MASVNSYPQGIGPAASSTRAGERFPYRVRPGHEEADTAAIRADLNEIIPSVMLLIRKVVRKRMANYDGHIRDEVVSDFLMHLMTTCLAKFDAHRGVKLSTFIYRCAYNHCSASVRKLTNDYKKKMVQLPAEDTIPGPDMSEDMRIERLADDILAKPERYLTKAQATWIRDCAAYPDSSVNERAERLGYRQASSASMLKARIRDRLVGLTQEIV